MAASDSKPIGLAEFIYQVKRELMQTTGEATDPVPLLAVEEVELEIAVTVTKKMEAGLRIQVVELGGGGERNNVHTVRVKLSPLMTRDERVAQLRQDPRWSQIVQDQMRATLKGLGGTSRKDEY